MHMEQKWHDTEMEKKNYAYCHYVPSSVVGNMGNIQTRLL
jgi:hypothetical protein